MKRFSVVLAALAACAAPALAGPLNSPPASQLPTLPFSAIVADDAAPPGGGGHRAITTVYDNWNNPPSLLTSLFRAGTDQIADDCTVVGPAGVGLLSNMGINCANIDAPSNLTGGQLAVRFYRLDTGVFINGFNANLPVLATPANSSNRLQFADGALDAFGIIIPTSGVYVSLQWNTATFSGAGTIQNLGYQTRSPNAVGSSTDNLFNVTTNASFNFGGAPLANTGIFLRTNDVPEPASLALIGLGALALLRRR